MPTADETKPFLYVWASRGSGGGTDLSNFPDFRGTGPCGNLFNCLLRRKDFISARPDWGGTDSLKFALFGGPGECGMAGADETKPFLYVRASRGVGRRDRFADFSGFSRDGASAITSLIVLERYGSGLQ